MLGGNAAGIYVAGRPATERHSDEEFQGACLALEVPTEVVVTMVDDADTDLGVMVGPFACPSWRHQQDTAMHWHCVCPAMPVHAIVDDSSVYIY